MGMLTRMMLSGLEFSTSTCDFNGASASPMFCYGGIVTCFGGLATSETLFACLGSLLTLMTFALRGVKDLYTTWQGTGLVASEASVGDGHA